MTDVVAVRNAVRDLFGRKGDETIREYIIAVLELGDYDFGRNGELAYEHFGQMLVCHSNHSRAALSNAGNHFKSRAF